MLWTEAALRPIALHEQPRADWLPTETLAEKPQETRHWHGDHSSTIPPSKARPVFTPNSGWLRFSLHAQLSL